MTLLDVTAIMGNIGEFVGSFAVLATLVYLTVQVREARSERLQVISEARAVAVRDINVYLTDERLCRIDAEVADALGYPVNEFERVVMERSGINREDARALFLMQMQQINYTRHQMQLAPKLSSLDRHMLETSIYYRWSPGSVSGLFYEVQATVMDPETRTYIDGILAQHDRFSGLRASQGKS